MDYQSERFKKFIPFILKEECDYPRIKTGEYTNLKNDAGGPTKWGIDLRGQKAYATQFGANPNDWNSARIKNLTLEEATDIYALYYWTGSPTHPHNCQSLAPLLGEVTMNSWVNGGKPTLWLNTCDGSPTAYLKLQENYYRSIVQNHPSQAQFLDDWLGRTRRLRDYLGLAP